MTPEQFDAIVAEIAGGVSVVEATANAGVNRATFYRAIGTDDTLCDRYARAKQSGAEAMADDIIAIADECAGDTYQNDDGAYVIAPDVVARAKLRVDTRKWLLAKLAPKKYGDRLTQEHTGAGGGPIRIEYPPADERVL